MLRDNEYSNIYMALHNVIETMALSRHFYLCDEDFSRLDFGNMSLNNIYFSIDGMYPSSFEKSTLCKNNFISGHSGRIFYARFSDDGNFLITWGFDGKIIIWDLMKKCLVKEIVAYAEVNPFFEWYNLKAYPYFKFDILKIRDDINIAKHIKHYLSDYIKEYELEFEISSESENSILNKLNSYNKLNILQRGESVCYMSKSSRYAIISPLPITCPVSHGYAVMDIEKNNLITDYELVTEISSDEKHYFILDGSWCVKVYDLESKSEIFSIIPNMHNVQSVSISPDNSACYSVIAYCSHITNVVSKIEWGMYSQKIEDREFTNSSYDKSQSGDCIRNRFPKKDGIEYFGYEDDNWDRFDGIKYIAKDHTFEMAGVGYENMDYSTLFYNDYISSKPMAMNVQFKCGNLDKNDKYFIYFSSMDSYYDDSENYNHSYKAYIVHWKIQEQREEFRVAAQLTENAFITSCDFSHDASLLIVGFSNGIVNVIDSKTGQLLRKFYHVYNINMKNCNLKNIIADDETKKIIYQQGAIINEHGIIS